MNFRANSPSPHSSTLYTTEEVAPTGCCFSIFGQSRPDPSQTLILPRRNYSERKVKKIDLVTTKRRHTQEKEIRKVSNESIQAKPGCMTKIKRSDTVTGVSSLTSKTTTQKNSLKGSVIKLVLEKNGGKVEGHNRNQRYLELSTSKGNKPIEATFSQTRANSSNIQFLSEISLVEEEFISNDSNTLKALDFLQQAGEDRPKLQETTPVRYMTECPQA